MSVRTLRDILTPDRSSTMALALAATVATGSISYTAAQAFTGDDQTHTKNAAHHTSLNDGKATKATGDRTEAKNTGKDTAKPVKLAKAADVVKLAQKQVGISEGKGGDTKFHKWFMSTPHAKKIAKRDGGTVKNYSGAAWCDMFVSWVGAHTNTKAMGSDAYTVSHADWFKKTGRWGKTPKPGAVVFFDWGGSKSINDIDHVGLVAKVNGKSNIRTVEGNTSNAVKSKTRDSGSIVGYGYPDYKK